MVAVLLAGALTAATAPVAAGAPPQGDRPFPDSIDLPDGFAPEGIAIGRGPTAYVGSLAGGDVARVDLRSGRVDPELVAGAGAPSVGLDVDRRGRLFIAGGESGELRVADTRTGELVDTYQVAEPGTSFVNDVIVTRDAAFATDSRNARLFVLPLERNGALPGAAETLQLAGEWVQTTGDDDFNANGITTTPDGSALLVVNSTTGDLFRVDPETGVATRVDLGDTDAPLSAGDGLLLEGTTLYVVRNALNEVAVVELSRDGTSGTIGEPLSSPDFDVPTTIDSFGGAFYLPNARFGTANPGSAAYSVTRLED